MKSLIENIFFLKKAFSCMSYANKFSGKAGRFLAANLRGPRENGEEMLYIEEMLNYEARSHSIRYKKILQDLKSNDEGKVLEAISNLCTQLSMIEDIQLQNFPTEAFIPEILKCLKPDGMADIMIHAAASLRHIAEMIPEASKILVNQNKIGVIFEKIQNLEYIDISENMLRVLERVSIDHSEAIINIGGLGILWNKIEFFLSPVQNIILNIFANVFKSFPSEHHLTQWIMPSLPGLNNFLLLSNSNYDGLGNIYTKLIERLGRLFAEDFEKKRKYIDLIFNQQLVELLLVKATAVVTQNFPDNEVANLENILKIMNKICYFSNNLFLLSLKNNLISIVSKGLFVSLSNIESKSSGLNYSKLSLECILVINSMLALRTSPHPLIAEIVPLVGIGMTDNPRAKEKLDIFKKNKEYMNELINSIFGNLFVHFEKCSRLFNKYLLLIIMEKLLIFGDFASILKVMNLKQVAFLLGKLLASEDMLFVSLSLIIIDLLVDRCDEIIFEFSREGVIEYVKRLSSENEVKRLIPFSIYTDLIQVGGIHRGKDHVRLEKNHPEQRPHSLSEKIQGENLKKAAASGHHSHSIERNGSQENLSGGPADKKPPIGPMNQKSLLLSNPNKGNASSPPQQEPLGDINAVEKIKKIRKDIMNLATSVNKKIQASSGMKSNQKSLQKINGSLQEILNNFKLPSSSDFGLSAFEKLYEFLQNNRNFTLHEIRYYGLLESLIGFLLGDSLKIISAKQEGQEFPEKEAAALAKRLYVLLYVFSKRSAKNPKKSILEDFIYSLKEMLNQFEKFYLVNYENVGDYYALLNADLKFLAERIKFKICFNNSHKKKNEFAQTLADKNLSSYQKSYIQEQLEMYEFKENLFKEVPVLVLSVEQFGTLEIVEEYLLNKMAGRQDSNHSGLFQNIFKKMQKAESSYTPSMRKMSEDDDEDEDDDDDGDLSDFDEDEDPQIKKSYPYMNKNPESNLANTMSPSKYGINDKKHSYQEISKSEQKGAKKSLVEKYSGKANINFRKHLAIEFFIDNIEIPKNSTIYETLQRTKKYGVIKNEESLIIEYRLVQKKIEIENYSLTSLLKEKPKLIRTFQSSYISYIENLLQKLTTIDTKSQLSEHVDLKYVLMMFVILYELNTSLLKLACWETSPFYELIKTFLTSEKLAPVFKFFFEEKRAQLETYVEKKEFINEKISRCFGIEFRDPLTIAGNSVPEFHRLIIKLTPFLVDFPTRFSYYKHISSHVSRSLYYIYHKNKGKLKNLESLRIGKLKRKKIRVPRAKVLENSIVNFESYGTKRSLLEFEFLDEEGSGLGPTLEYYSLVSQEVLKPDYKIWRKTDDGLLFPNCIDPMDLFNDELKTYKSPEHKHEKKVEAEKSQLIFRMIGVAVARAILDERLIDLPFHPLFWDIVLDRPLYLEDILRVDKNLGELLIGLKAIILKRDEIEKNTSLTPAQKTSAIENLKYKECPIEDLELYFTFPGCDEVMLHEKGDKTKVTISNLHQYVEEVARFFLEDAIRIPIIAFRDGFDRVIPLSKFAHFCAEEIEETFCGSHTDGEQWIKTDLLENIIPAHGFSSDSQTYLNFVETLTEFNKEEQRHFLKFITGSTRLPFGGFKDLNPKINVVKKLPEMPNQKPDDILPSVMTCQNYVKLPDYTTKLILKQKLKYSMLEGQNNFTLS